MQLPSGPWCPQISDKTSIAPAAAKRVAPISRAEPNAAAEAAEIRNDDDLEVLGVYQKVVAVVVVVLELLLQR